jgi:hypothetical protein
MHPPRLTIGSLLFIVAAFSIGLAALKENDLKRRQDMHCGPDRSSSFSRNDNHFNHIPTLVRGAV